MGFSCAVRAAMQSGRHGWIFTKNALRFTQERAVETADGHISMPEVPCPLGLSGKCRNKPPSEHSKPNV